MAISHKGGNSTNHDGSASFTQSSTMAEGGSIAAGDFMVLVVETAEAANTIAVAGWTKDVSNNQGTGAVFRRVATGSESAGWAVTLGDGFAVCVTFDVWTGVDLTTPLLATIVTNNDISTTYSVGAASVPSAGHAVLAMTTFPFAGLTAATTPSPAMGLVRKSVANSFRDFFSYIWDADVSAGSLTETGSFLNGGTPTNTTWGAALYILNPGAGSAGASPPPIRINQRAPGFPPRAPLPGLARLGRGILVSPSLGAPSAGTADAAASSFATSASGLVTFTATGSSAFSAFAADSVAAFALNVTNAQWAYPQPISRGLGRAARLPAPPPFRLGYGILATYTASGFAGTSSAAFSPFGVSASGLLTFSATGSAALAAFAAGSTGTETFSGSGSAAESPFAVSAAALEAYAGIANCTTSQFAVTGVALETYASTGVSAFAAFAVTASGLESFSGSGSAACSPFGSSGNGANGTVFVGTAASSLAAFAAGSTGAETFACSGTSALSSFAGTGSGSESFAGAGSAATTPFGVLGNAALGAFFAGSGSATFSPFGLSAAGLQAFASTGSAIASPFAVAGTGSESFSATASATVSPFALTAAAFVGDFIGVGSSAFSPFAIISLGLVPITYTHVSSRTRSILVLATPTSHTI